MSSYNIRLGSMLTFDEEQEADIIQVIEKLNSIHKTGQFLSNLIRVALDCPEILDQSNGKFVKGSTLVDLEQYGLTYNRRALADKNARDISEMKKKVDSIYDMILKMYTLTLMGKHLGLEEKTENSMMAHFMVEKQLNDLKNSLGITLSDNLFKSNKVQDTKKLAEESLEYIIDAYSGVVNELKSNFSKNKDNSTDIAEALMNMLNNSNSTKNENNTASQNVVYAQAPVIVKQESVIENTSKVEEPIEQEEVLDFGLEDLGDLGNFFGV